MRIWYRLTGLAVFLLSAAPASAQEKSPEAQKAMDAVRKHIDGLKNGSGAGELKWKDDAALRDTFRDYHFINARFRQFPVARILPEGLRPSSLFAVDKEGKVEFFKDTATMEKFFQANFPKVKDEKGAEAALAVWLTLSQEFHQDGFFTFQIRNKEFSVAAKDGLQATGGISVEKGGNGKLDATLQFDKDGKLAKAEEKAAIRPGPRPICQATKLLDADPIVRRIAEQDLLIMGLAARDYLMEQRELAAPDLRHAIDRLWAQIQKNGW
jgi:hypothetical protein